MSLAQTDSTSQSISKRLLEKGHLVRLILARDIGSSVAQEGNKVYFAVDSAVVVSGITLIPKGTSAYGTITSVRERKQMGVAGKLSFSIDKVVLNNGKIIPLSFDYSGLGKNRTAQSIIEAGLLSPLFILKKGKDVTYKEGRPFVAYVAQDYTF